MVNKKATSGVSQELSKYLRNLHQGQNLSIRSLSRKYSQFSLLTTWRHATKNIKVHAKHKKRNDGCKPKLSKRDD